MLPIRILNHEEGTISGVAAVYQRHEFLAERKEALDRWGAHVERTVQTFRNRNDEQTHVEPTPKRDARSASAKSGNACSMSASHPKVTEPVCRRE